MIGFFEVSNLCVDNANVVVGISHYVGFIKQFGNFHGFQCITQGLIEMAYFTVDLSNDGIAVGCVQLLAWHGFPRIGFLEYSRALNISEFFQCRHIC